MRFEWDEDKNKENIKKHGISFERAITIFDGIVLTEIDERQDYGEIREKSYGFMARVILVVVIHTDRNGKIRIISARKATKKERRAFHARTGTYY